MFYANRVKETTATTGTGTYTLSGVAATGFQTFTAAGADGNQMVYVVSTDTTWEINIGTYTSATKALTRDRLIASSSGTTISWGSGDKDVLLTLSADLIASLQSGIGVQDMTSVADLWTPNTDLTAGAGDFTFAWTNQGTATAEVANGALVMTAPSSGTHALRILGVTESATSWEYRARVSALASRVSDAVQCGLVVWDNTQQNFITWAIRLGGGWEGIDVLRWSSVTTVDATDPKLNEQWALQGGGIWFRIVKNSNTDYDFDLSMNGKNWMTWLGAYNPSAFFSTGQDRIGLVVNTKNNNPAQMRVDAFFKV